MVRNDLKKLTPEEFWQVLEDLRKTAEVKEWTINVPKPRFHR